MSSNHAQQVGMVFSTLHLKSVSFPFQLLKQYVMFPNDDSCCSRRSSLLVELSPYDPLIFDDHKLHALFKILQTKVGERVMWAFFTILRKCQQKKNQQMQQQQVDKYENENDNDNYDKHDISDKLSICPSVHQHMISISEMRSSRNMDGMQKNKEKDLQATCDTASSNFGWKGAGSTLKPISKTSKQLESPNLSFLMSDKHLTSVQAQVNPRAVKFYKECQSYMDKYQNQPQCQYQSQCHCHCPCPYSHTIIQPIVDSSFYGQCRKVPERNPWKTSRNQFGIDPPMDRYCLNSPRRSNRHRTDLTYLSILQEMVWNAKNTY